MFRVEALHPVLLIPELSFLVRVRPY